MLNEQQKQAVEHDSGPLLIIAGAGTGKTRVITSRILHLIESVSAKPNEILALTFTEKAANEMIERVDEGMPLSYDQLHISTFHSFADHVLRESGMEIGIDPGYKILPDTEQWFFFKKHLFEFELDYYRPLGNPNKFIYSLIKHFSRLKDEMIEPEKYLKYAESIDGEEGVKMLEVARAYSKYQELMIKNNFLDFADLNFYVNKLFERRESCLKKYQNLFKYIMVDEFQDTNYAQFQLILKLSDGHKNIAVVGDDDQSIYKWRGASLSNILQFERHFPECKKVVLSENYRSSKNILDSSYALIQNNNPDRLEVRIGVNKKLNCNISENEKVEVHHFADFLQESSFVAEKIKELSGNPDFEYSNCAILVRANQLTHPFIDELKYLNIPYQVRNPKGLFALDEIKDLLAVVRVLANPNDDVALLRLLKMDIFDISMQVILELLNGSKNSHLFKQIDADEQTLAGMEGGQVRLKRLLIDLIEFSKNHSVGITINEFIQKSQLLNYLIEKEKFEELDNINEFAKQVAKFEKENENRSVRDFVEYLNLLEEANAVFAHESFSDRNSVQILTVHGSKGLEFDNVFIVNTVRERFPGRPRGEAFELPEELTKEIYPEGNFHLQEERRLFYVAMTRARKKLFISYSDQYEGNKKWKRSPFADEVLQSESSVLMEHGESEDALKRLKTFRKPDKSIFDLPPFTDKRLSYSKLNTFQTCPLQFNYRYLMNVPVGQSHAANFGSSIHGALNEFYRLLKSGKSVTKELLSSLYEKNWVGYGYESAEHERTRKEQGHKMLEDFFDANCDPWVVPAYLEQPFNVKIGDYVINGRIDRIDRLADGTFEVVDYKTGSARDTLNLKKDMQLSVYALACREILKIPVSKLTLYFIEDNQRLSTSGRSDIEIENFKVEVLEFIEKMKSSEFAATPGFHCQYCDFRLICPAV